MRLQLASVESFGEKGSKLRLLSGRESSLPRSEGGDPMLTCEYAVRALQRIFDAVKHGAGPALGVRIHEVAVAPIAVLDGLVVHVIGEAVFQFPTRQICGCHSRFLIGEKCGACASRANLGKEGRLLEERPIERIRCQRLQIIGRALPVREDKNTRPPAVARIEAELFPIRRQDPLFVRRSESSQRNPNEHDHPTEVLHPAASSIRVQKSKRDTHFSQSQRLYVVPPKCFA